MRPAPARVLIVEDEAIAALDLERRVRAIGHSVVGSADSAALAIQCVREQRPDLVLMDIRLKGERDGVSVAEEIRRELDVPTVFLTAFSDRQTVGRAVTVEPLGYVVKPVDDRSLEIAMDVALYRHDAERQIRQMRRASETRTDIEVESKAGAGSRFSLVFPEAGSPAVDSRTDRSGAGDLDDRKQSEETLHRLVEFEAFLFDLSSTFIGLPDEQLDGNMVLGLARVGEFLATDRVTLLELSPSGDEMVVAYSWSAGGVQDAPHRIPRHAQPWWFGEILRGAVSLAAHIDDLPEEAAQEKDYLRQRGVASAASIPLRVGGVIAGAISFVTVHRHESWTAERVKQLKAVGDILWNALKRRQAMHTLSATQDLVAQSEERFRLAMNNVAAGVYTLDLHGRVTYVNPAAEAMFGWTMGELLGKKMHDVTHYEHPDGTPFPASECPGLQVLKEGIELREQSDMFIRRNGQFFPVVYSASPLKKRDGTTVGIVVGCRDDTLHREAERVIRDSEERFRLVANTAPVIIWMSDVDKQWTFVNESWVRFTGQMREAAFGNRWMDVLSPEDVEQVREKYANACDRREPFQMEYRLRRYDGAYRWVFVQGEPRYDASRSFAGYTGSAIDVTERKEAEDVLSTLSQKLIEAQELERARLARELHDDITQRLTLLVLSLGAVKQKCEGSVPALGLEIGEAVDAALTLTGDVQSLSHRLHSSQLRHLGLAAAARSLCSEFSERTTADIQFHSESSVSDLPEDVSLNLYRVSARRVAKRRQAQSVTAHRGVAAQRYKPH